MDGLRLKYEIKRNGYTIDDFCKELKIERSTFYRKVKGTSEFTQSEIQKSIELLHLETPMNIFFTQEVS